MVGPLDITIYDGVLHSTAVLLKLNCKSNRENTFSKYVVVFNFQGADYVVVEILNLNVCVWGGGGQMLKSQIAFS